MRKYKVEVNNCLSKDALTLFISQLSPSYLQSLDVNKVLKNLLDKVLSLKRDIPQACINERNRKE